MEDRDRQFEQTLVTDDVSAEIAGVGGSEEPAPTESTGAQPVGARPASWTYFALGMIVAMIILDQFVAYLGTRFFWSEQGAYFTSLGFRTIVLALAAQYWYDRYFSDARTLYVVSGLIAIASGLIIAIMLFAASPVFWTFINLVIGPVDAVLLALLASRFLARIHSINKLTKTYG